MLRSSSQVVAVFLIIAVVAMPVTACLVPDRQMTAEEQSCCKNMDHGCESAVMPDSHSCCQHPALRQTASVKKVQCGDLTISPGAFGETAIARLTPPIRSAFAKFESPPESPPASINVLRI